VLTLARGKARLGEVTAVLGGAALLAASWVVVKANDQVPLWEARIFVEVNGLSDLLWPIVWPPMQLGNFVGSLIVVAGTALVSKNARLTVAALLASQVAFWTAKIVKQLVSRGRPTALLQDVHVRESAGGLGYISGHSAVAFALGAVLAPSLSRRWRVVAFVVAGGVGFSRIYAGVHLPLDVVGGAGFGLLFGTISRWLFGLGGEGLSPRPGVDPA
jgi:undecaprenyl-diphosphatase